MLGRLVFLSQIPLHLVLILWVLIGRVFFGAGGWFFVFFLFLGVPLMLVTLGLTSALSFLQPDRPRTYTTTQAWCHLVMWAAMLVFGFALVDAGDTDESVGSALTQVFGETDRTLALSNALSAASALVGVVCWVAILALAVMAIRRRASPPVAR